MTKALYVNVPDVDVPDFNALAKNPFFVLSSKVANVYADAMRQNMEQMTASSTKIMQEQVIQAWTNAAHACAEALVQNAVSSQEQVLDRITKANQKALEIFAANFIAFKL